MPTDPTPPLTLRQRLDRIIDAASFAADSSETFEDDIEALRLAIASLEDVVPNGWATQALQQLRAVAPEVDVPCVAVAEKQQEYLTVYAGLACNPGYPAVVRPDGTRWNTHLLALRPDRHHLAALAAGADIYVSLLTFGRPMPPFIVQVGKASVAAAYNVRMDRKEG